MDQSHAVDYWTEPEVAHLLGATEEQRRLRAGDVGDDAVRERRMPVGQAGSAVQAGGEAGDGRGDELGVVGHQPGTDGVDHLLGASGPGVHGGEALQGVFDVGAKRNGHGRHLVALRALLIFGAHRDRRHCEKRLSGQLALLVKVCAHRTADDRQHDVVHRCAGHGGAHLLHVGEREADALEHPMRAYGRVEAGSRRGELWALERVAAHPLHDAADGRDRPADDSGEVHRLADVADARP